MNTQRSGVAQAWLIGCALAGMALLLGACGEFKVDIEAWAEKSPSPGTPTPGANGTPSPGVTQEGLIIEGLAQEKLGGPGAAGVEILVIVGDADGPNDQVVAITDPDGHYISNLLPVPPDTSVQVWARRGDQFFNPTDDPTRIDAFWSWTHSGGFELRRLDFVATVSTTIEGHVYRAPESGGSTEGPQGLAGADLEFQVSGYRYEPRTLAVTDADGYYANSISMPLGVDVILRPVAPGYGFEPQVRRFDGPGDQPVMITLDFFGEPLGPTPTAVAFDGDIAFDLYDPASDNQDIWIMSGNSRALRNLTDHPAYDSDPAWSPDGRRIAFVSNRDGNAESYVVHADGSGLVKLTDDPRDDSQPSWSPDSTRIVFVSDRDGDPEIFTMADNGSAMRQLTTNSGLDQAPAWSPDGRWIAFTSDQHINQNEGEPDGRGYTREIYLIQSDGSSMMQLTNLNGFASEAAWSPDGSWIVFTGFYQDDKVLFLIELDLSVENPMEQWLADISDDKASGNPTWAPDGDRIAFISGQDGNSAIYLVKPDGLVLGRPSDLPGPISYLAWHD